jgi:hypothetical protein
MGSWVGSLRALAGGVGLRVRHKLSRQSVAWKPDRIWKKTICSYDENIPYIFLT